MLNRKINKKISELEKNIETLYRCKLEEHNLYRINTKLSAVERGNTYNENRSHNQQDSISNIQKMLLGKPAETGIGGLLSFAQIEKPYPRKHHKVFLPQEEKNAKERLEHNGIKASVLEHYLYIESLLGVVEELINRTNLIADKLGFEFERLEAQKPRTELVTKKTEKNEEESK